MKKYYQVILGNSHVNNPYIYDETNFNELNLKEDDFYSSNKINLNDKKIKFYSCDEHSISDLDDVLQSVWLPIVSEKVMNYFKKIDNKFIQIIPVELYANNKKLNIEYYILNFLSSIDAIDLDKSFYTTKGQVVPHLCRTENEKNEIIEILDPILKYDIIKKYDFFKAKYDKHHFYISEKIKNYLEKNNLYGWELIPTKISETYLENEIPNSNESFDVALTKEDENCLTSIIPDDLEPVSVILFIKYKIFFIEDQNRMQRFAILSEDKKSSNKYDIRYILSKLWFYSENNNIKKGDLISIEGYNEGSVFYGFVDEIIYQSKIFLCFVYITSYEYNLLNADIGLLKKIKENTNYLLSDFERKSVL